MLGSSIQGIQAEYSVGSENKYFSKVDKNNFHKNVNRKELKTNENKKKRSIQWSNQSIQAEYSVE